MTTVRCICAKSPFFFFCLSFVFWWTGTRAQVRDIKYVYILDQLEMPKNNYVSTNSVRWRVQCLYTQQLLAKISTTIYWETDSEPNDAWHIHCKDSQNQNRYNCVTHIRYRTRRVFTKQIKTVVVVVAQCSQLTTRDTTFSFCVCNKNDDNSVAACCTVSFINRKTHSFGHMRLCVCVWVWVREWSVWES